MPSSDPNSPNDSKPQTDAPVSRRADRLGKADSWEAAKKQKAEAEKNSDKHPKTAVVIYSKRALGHQYWRQDPGSPTGDAPGRAPKGSTIVGYELFRVPAELVTPDGFEKGDSEALKSAIKSALDGGGHGPGSDVGPK